MLARVTDAAIGRLRGAAFHELLVFFAHTQGPDALRAVGRELVARGLPLEPDQPALGMDACGWYSGEDVHALLDALTEHFDPAARRLFAEQAGMPVTLATLCGPNRLLFRMMATPERYARHAHKLWRASFEDGDIRVEHTPGESIHSIRNWSAHHPFLCELLSGTYAATYTGMACRSVRVERTECVDAHGSCCRFVVRWDETEPSERG